MPKPKTGLRSIPGVGKRVEQDLRDLGMKRPSCLKSENPEKLYAKLNRLRGATTDRCMLYVLRCAVYFARTKNPDPEKLKWWNWSDKNLKNT